MILIQNFVTFYEKGKSELDKGKDPDKMNLPDITPDADLIEPDKKEKKQEQITKKILPIVEQIMRGTNG